MRNIILITTIFIFISNNVFTQKITPFYQKLLQENNNINFPKRIVYDAPIIFLNTAEYNRLGFSYISNSSFLRPSNEPNSSKYILWTGVSQDNPGANWFKNKSPYGNDIEQFKKTWDYVLNLYYNRNNNPDDKSKIGIMMLDVEAKLTDEELNRMYEKQTQYLIKEKKDIYQYKKAMSDLYYISLNYARTFHNNYKLWSSFGDVPVEKTWWGIPRISWQKRTTDPSLLNYITNTFENGEIRETSFAKNLDFYSVDTYYIYNSNYSDKVWAAQYLAYMLYQLEANLVWAQKPVYLYHTFKFQGERERNTLIDENMVRNSVIFAFLSGADGMILYDDTRSPTNDPKYHQLIKTFVESITILNNYRDYFIDKKNVTFFRPNDPVDLFVNHKSVIRGIEKNGKLLLAATNSFAESNEITNLSIYYKGKLINISLLGTETYLKEIILE